MADRTSGGPAYLPGRDEALDGGRRSANIALWIGLALVAVACAYRLAIFKAPVFDGDEYAFALSGRDVLHGMLPNTGVFDNKPVGLIYLLALAEALGGPTVFALRALGLAACAATGAMLYGASRALQLRRAGALVIAAFFMLGTLCTGGVSTMSELLACPLLAAANTLLAGGKRTPLALLVLGAAFGLACQITYLAAPCAVLTVLGRLMIDRRGSPWTRMSQFALIALGGGLAALAVWAPQIVAGRWPDYLAEQLSYHQGYRLSVFGWQDWAVGFAVPLAGMLLPIIFLLLMRPQVAGGGALPPLFWIMGLQALGAVLAATASNRFYPHYLILALPAFAMMAALLLAHTPPSERRGGWIALLILLSIAAALPLNLIEGRLKTPAVEAQAAAVVEQLTRPGQAIFVFDEAPAIYYLAQRPAVGRYIFPSHYLSTCDHAPAIRAPDLVLGQALTHRPALVLIGAVCPPEIDAEAQVRKAGYRPVYELEINHRRISFNAPDPKTLVK